MAIVNDIYYYRTTTCPTGTSGYGQRTTQCEQTGCMGSNCNCTVRQIKIDVESKKASPGLSECDSLPGSPATPEDKLKEIIKECRKLEKYVKKVAKSSEISVTHKNRIKQWADSYLSDLIKYLEYSGAGADSADMKLAKYCTTDLTTTPQTVSVPEAYRQAEARWSKAAIEWNLGRIAHLNDEPQAGPLKPEGSIEYKEENGFAITKMGIQRVTVSDVPNAASKTLYFSTFRITKSELGNTYYTYGGFQVEAPMSPPAGDTATMKDRHAFGHVIKFGSAVFLVTSVDDLSIAEDP